MKRTTLLCLLLSAALSLVACASDGSRPTGVAGIAGAPGVAGIRGLAAGAASAGTESGGGGATTPPVVGGGTVTLPGSGHGGGWVDAPGGGPGNGHGPGAPSGGGSSSGTAAGTYRFVWLADSRGTAQGDPVNAPVLSAIVRAIGALSPQPSFVIFGGDMSFRGYIGTSYTYQAWEGFFTPLTSAGIPLYTAIGNHELYREHQSGFFLANQQEFQAEFSGNPSNGPAGYEHLTYSFESPDGSAFFAVLDPYYLTADSVPSGLGGEIDPTQMSWLTAQVAQTKATHKFLFIHTPYYYVNEDPEELSSANASYTNLWAFLDANRFDVYACGHSHLYARRTIDGSVAPDPQVSPPVQWQNGVVQLLNGTAGAGPDTAPPVLDATLWNTHNDPATYYFSVFDISGDTVTVNSYAGDTGDYTVVDTFTVTR